MKRRRRRSRRNRWLITLAALIALYTVVGFFLAPPLARSQLIERLSTALDREVTIEKVRINPFTFSTTIDGLRIIDHDGAELAGWQSAYVNFDPLMSLFRWQWQIGEIHLVEPRQHLRIASDGTVNIGDLLAPAAPNGAEETDEATLLPAVGVSRLLVEGWSFAFTDESRHTPFHTVAGPMTFSATGFSTRAEAGSPYSFTGTTDSGESFAFSGDIAAQPLGSTGQLEFIGFSIPKHMPFAEEFFHGRVASGTLALRTDYAIVLAGEPSGALSDTTLVIADLSVTSLENGSGDVALDRLEVTMPAADPFARTAEISRIALDGLVVHVTRRQDGSIDLLDFVPPGPAHSDEDAAVASVPAPSVVVAEISVVNSAVTITDESNARATTVALGDITATATNAGTDLDREIGIGANLSVNEGGTVAIDGRVRLRPLAAQLNISAEDVALSPFDAYVPPPADVRVLRGTLNARGQVEAEQRAGEELALRWSGDAAIDGFGVADHTGRNELVAWDRLAFATTSLSLEPLEVSIHEITWDAPVIRATVASDGRLALLDALTGANAGDPGPTPESPAAPDAEEPDRPPPFTATIDAVIINDGRIMVHDRSTTPEFISSLRDFSGSIRGLSSATPARAEVNLHAMLDRSGTLAVTGTINPLADDLFTDLDIAFHDIALPAFSPYAGRYLGRTIETGTLNLDLAYHISQNVLQGDNHVMLDQFFLGDTVPSEQAIKLPIGLALAVLRDRAGVIQLPPTPVTGNLEDPEFKIGPLVMHALTNAFIKAATAPFSMLGGMFGAREDQDLSYGDFAAGSAELSPDTTEKLSILAKALYASPALRLAINSVPAPEFDRPVLRDRKFESLLREEKRLLMLAWAATEGRGENSTPDAEITVDAEEIDDLVRYAFVRRFPERAAEVDLATAPPSDDAAETPPAPAPTEEEPNTVQKILRTIFGRRDRDSPAATPSPPAPPTTVAEAAETDGEEAAEPALTVGQMREQLRATIEIPDVAFQDLARQRSIAIREHLLTTGNVEPERVTIAADPAPPENAQVPENAARVFFSLE